MGNKCSNHPDRESIAPCHSCGKHFCKDCLIEGKEYFYCKEDKCQAFLKKENSLFEVTGGERTIFFKQRWKENSRRFYRKTGLILFISWILLTIFFFLVTPSYKMPPAYVLLLMTLRTCVGLFIFILLIRITIYKPIIWKRRISEEFDADRQ